VSESARHEEMRDDLAAYALGALDPGEAAAVAEHLATCESCREYVRWLGPAVDLLPASVAQVEPPERLRESLMATVRAEAAEAGTIPAEPRPAGRERRRWGGWGDFLFRPATALAAVAVLAVGGAVGYALHDDGSDRVDVPAEATGEVPSAAISASVEHGAGGAAILHVDRIPALDRDRVYEAWAMSGSDVEPVLTFRPSKSGAFNGVMSSDLDGADAVLVTEEPRNVGSTPTTAPILKATL
jgi:anti-sigma-K factor RskA